MSSTPPAMYKKAGELLNPATTQAKITSQAPLDNKDAKFINLEKLTYISPVGEPGVWEIARRTTRPKESLIDAVIIVPMLRFPNGDKKLVFVRQYRPPTGGVCVELPAGLVDPHDTVEGCALRELKEETGYTGVVRKKSGVVWSDPGLSDASSCFVWIDVDMSLETNQNPVPKWMDNEVIEVVSVHIGDIEETMKKWMDQGYLIDAKIEAFILGMSIAL